MLQCCQDTLHKEICNTAKTQVQLYTLWRMALAFVLVKQMLKLENSSKDACVFGRDLCITSLAVTCARKPEASYPKPHRSQLLEGLRPTLKLNTFHHWPGVSCSPLPQGLHQPLLPLQLKLKDLAVRQRRCPGQRAFHDSNASREYQQAVTMNGQERAQHELQLRLKHVHGEGSVLKSP